VAMERELFAVPGPADSPLSEAPHALLKQGALPACGAQDVLDHLPPGLLLSAQVSAPAPAARTASLSLEYRKILELLCVDVLTVEQLRAGTGIELPRLSNILFEMELQALVSPVPGQRYAKSQEIRR
jgi:DNA processing protein